LINFVRSIRTSWNIMIAEKLNTITFRDLILMLLSILQQRRCHYWIDLPERSKFLERKFVARISACCG